MEARINLIISSVIFVGGLVCVGFAQEGMVPGEDANAVSVPAFPYVAQITADDVYYRSGAGTNYYPCGRLKKGDKVTVVGGEFGWSRIVPPAGSFSWVSTQYVTVDPQNAGVGTITGNSVRVYVGSEYTDLIHSTTPELKLNRGDKVKLTGEQNSGYYKIAPPAGSYRWVSTKYTEPVSPSVERPEPVIAPPEAPVTTAPGAPTAPGGDTGPAVVPTRIPDEAGWLQEYYALEKRIEAERANPVMEQDYAGIKKGLLEVASDKQAGKAARYSQFALKQVERFELALEVAKTVQLQNAQLQKSTESIAKARAKRLADVKEMGRFVVMGRLQFFTTYGPGHYRILDDSGKTLCYALPSGPVSLSNLGKLVGRKVGLVGTVEPHVQTAGALVRFTEIVELD